jgi:hypothetical protein
MCNLTLCAVARDEGVRGFYRGFAPPLLLTGFVNTVRDHRLTSRPPAACAKRGARL